MQPLRDEQTSSKVLRSEAHGEVDLEKQSMIGKLDSWRLLIMYLSTLSMGMTVALLGTTAPYLLERLQVTFAEYGQFLAIRSIGRGVGPLVGGLILSKVPKHSDMVAASSFILEAIITAVIPWIQTPGLMTGAFFLYGIPPGIRQPAFRLAIINLVGERAGPALLLLSTMRTMGVVLTPFIVNAFIYVPPPGIDNLTLTISNGTNLKVTLPNNIITSISGDVSISEIRTNDSQNVPVDNLMGIEASIEYPYGIFAAIYFCFAMLFVTLWLLMDRNKEKCDDGPKPATIRNWRNVFSTITYNARNILFALITVCFMAFIANASGIDETMLRYLYSYALEGPPKFSPTDAALIVTAFSTANVVGRLVSMICSYLWNTEAVFIINLIMSVIAITATVTWGNSGKYVLILLTCAISFFESPLVGLGIAIGHQHTKLTVGLMTALHLSLYISDAFYDWLMGYLIDLYDMSAYFYVILGTSLITSVMFFMYRFLVTTENKCGARYENFE